MASAPSVITRVEIHSITARSARIVWWAPASNGGAAITNYGLRVLTVDNTEGVGGGIAFWDYTGLVGEKTLTNLQRNTTYYVFVRAVNSVGWSPFNPSFTFTTPPELPSAPTDYGVSDVTSETAYTTMPKVADTGGAALTDVQIEHAPWTYTAPPADTVTTLTAGAYRAILIRGQTSFMLQYRMRVANPAGWGPWGAWTLFGVTMSGPSEPANITIAAAGPGVMVSWSPPANLRGTIPQSYVLRYAKNPSFSDSLTVLTLPVNVNNTGPTPVYEGNTAFIEGLTAGTWYFQLWTLSDGGTGAYTEPRAFTIGGSGGGSPSSSAVIKLNGAWRPGVVWMKLAGTWKPGVLWRKTNNTWRT